MPLPQTHLPLFTRVQRNERKQTAWQKLDHLYRPIVLEWCRRKMPDDVAEDMTQEILWKLYRDLTEGRYDPSRGRFRSWLKAVVGNAIRDYYRQQARHQEPVARGGTKFGQWMMQRPHADKPAEDEQRASDDATPLELARRVQQRVTEQSWRVFNDLAVRGLNVQEAAAANGLSTDAVYKIRSRVANAFRKEQRMLAETVAFEIA